MGEKNGLYYTAAGEFGIRELNAAAEDGRPGERFESIRDRGAEAAGHSSGRIFHVEKPVADS